MYNTIDIEIYPPPRPVRPIMEFQYDRTDYTYILY